MGKPQPSAPTPVDPTTVANAQTASNDQTAQFQSQLNNTNIVGPNGTIDYTQNPNTNQWTQATTLSPAQQAIYDQGTAAQGAALGIANNQLGNVQTALNTPLNAPSMQTGVTNGPIAGSYDPGGTIANSFNPGQAVQGQVAPAGQIQSGYAPGGAIQNGYASGGPIQSGVAQTGVQTGFDQGAQPIQGQIGTQNVNQAVNNTIGANFAQQMQLLNPQMQQASEQQQAQMAAQGLNPNSAAFQNSQTLFNNAQAVQLDQAAGSAVNAGNAEQNTLFGQQAQQGQFANSAQAQQAGENLQEANLYNSASGQQFNQGVTAGQFANTAQQQANTQNQQQAAFGNTAQQQANAQNAAAAAFANSAQGQQYGQNLQSGTFANTAAGQQYAQNQGQAAFANTAQAQQNTQNQGQAAFANTAQQQGNSQALANASLNNQAQQADFTNQAYAQQLPINEFNSLMSSGQVQAPQAANGNTSVAPTDVTGAYALQAQQQQAAYQAQMANYQSGLGGLFNLGSAAMLAA